MKNTTVLLVGPPGGGKKTLTDALVAEKVPHNYLEMGEIMREIGRGESHDGALIRSYQATGRMVPDEVTLRVAESFVGSVKENGLLICDGFPRTVNQVEAGLCLLKNFGYHRFIVLHIVTDKEICVDRLLKRGRGDTKKESDARGRIEVYEHETLPLMDHLVTLPELRKNIITISGDFMMRDAPGYAQGLIKLYNLIPVS